MTNQKEKLNQEDILSQGANKAGGVLFWYKHSLDDDGAFCRNMETADEAKTQLGMTYQLMRHLQDSNHIEDYGDNNTGGFKETIDGEVVNNLVRDNSIDATIVEAEPKEGDLRVWYLHQFGGNGMFSAPVSTPDIAMEFLYTTYDLMLYLLEQGSIRDYCNAGGLEVYESNGKGGYEWCEWYSEDGFDVGEIMAMYMDDDCE